MRCDAVVKAALVFGGALRNKWHASLKGSGDRRAADVVVLFNHQSAQTGPRQVCAVGESVMACADDDDLVCAIPGLQPACHLALDARMEYGLEVAPPLFRRLPEQLDLRDEVQLECLLSAADELLARLIQHELDHLDGVLVLDHLDDDQRRLYDLIWKRTLASQMAAAKLDRVIVDITADDGSAGGNSDYGTGTGWEWVEPFRSPLSFPKRQFWIM